MSLHRFKCSACGEEHFVFTDEIMNYAADCCTNPILEIQEKKIATVGTTTHPASMHRQYDSIEKRREWVKRDAQRAEDEAADKGFHESVKNK